MSCPFSVVFALFEGWNGAKNAKGRPKELDGLLSCIDIDLTESRYWTMSLPCATIWPSTRHCRK